MVFWGKTTNKIFYFTERVLHLDKVKKFLQDKGYLIVILICVVALVAAGVSLVKLSPDENDVVLKSSPSAKPYATSQSGISGGRPTQTPRPTDNSQDVSRPITPAPTKKPENTITQMTKPMEGEVQVPFAAKKLVYNSTLKEWRTHCAVDIAGKSGDSVKAAYNGRIASVKIDPRYGLTVIVDHTADGSFTTVYCGLDTLKVALGDEVTQGSVIGTLGAEVFCEKSQGAHLHFEVIKEGEYLDPQMFWK